MTTKVGPELLPCPFCGSKMSMGDSYSGAYWQTYCRNQNCQASGPKGLTENAAIERANRRTVPPVAPTEASVQASASKDEAIRQLKAELEAERAKK